MPDFAEPIQEGRLQGLLQERLLAALLQEGKDPDRLDPEDLAAVDQFHVGGRRESLELLVRAGFGQGDRLLDVGCGLGGPARMLAGNGCSVVALDLSEEFCALAAELSRLTGLEGRVSAVRADAVRLPFDASSFDGVWLQHLTPNVENKQALFAEIARVIRPGGVLAVHEVCLGGGGDALYPAPWATRAEESYLATPRELRGYVQRAGLEITSFEDRTEFSASWFVRMLAKTRESGTRPVGLHLLFGSETPTIMDNMLRNLGEQRVRVMMGVARKP